jgi:hypothetical protein
MVFCPTNQLATTFKKMVTKGDNSVASEDKNAAGYQTATVRNLITAKDVQTAADNNQDAITLARGGLITPLAKDQAMEYGIRIIRAGS